MNKRVLNTFFLVVAGIAFLGCETTESARETAVMEPLDRSKRPESGPAPTAAFPDYETVTLSNGLTLYIIASERQPTVTYRLMFRSGGLFDGNKPGLSELMANMLDRGVEGKSAFELASEIDFIGAGVSAESSSDFTAVTVSGLSKYSSELQAILKEVVLTPTFPQEELDKLKQLTLSNLASAKKAPSDLAGKLRRKLVYGEGAYGMYQTEESVAAVTRDDLIAYHKAHFKPNNASLAIVGDVEPKKVSKEIEALFADWEKGDLEPLPDYEFPKVEGVTVHIVDRPESVQSVILVAQQSFARNHPDLRQMRVVMSVLGGGSFS
ncbi:MAG: pitrilysin family protein, partial [Verrucomicrobiota bacterium]